MGDMLPARWLSASGAAPTGPSGVAGLRALFPVLSQHIQGRPLADLGNAATTQMPQPLLDALQHVERHDRANIHRGVHTLSQRATDAFERARSDLKRFVGARPDHELVFTSGTTDALNMVAHGLSTAGHRSAWLQAGDEIVVSGLEHHAHLVPWQQAARRTRAVLRVLLPDAQGRLHVADLRRLLTPAPACWRSPPAPTPPASARPTRPCSSSPPPRAR